MVKDYHRKIPHIITTLCKKSFEEINIHDVAQFLKKFPPKQSNNYRSALKIIFQYAIAEGLLDKNLADATIKKTVEIKRQRLTLDGFNTIKQHAPHLATKRHGLGFLVSLQWENIHDGFIWIQQQKVDKWSVGKIKIPTTPEIVAILIKCENPTEFVISYNEKPVTGDYLSKAFLKARNASNYFTEMNDPPSFHEIRALSSFIQKKAGIETSKTQVLLGHTSEKMTEHYQERHEVIWQEVDQEILEKFWEFLEKGGQK